jgi:excisionase family DNA binding protein
MPTDKRQPGKAKLLSPEALADELDVSVRTIHRWVRRNEIPVMRAGRLLRFDRDEVLAAMRKGAVGRSETVA